MAMMIMGDYVVVMGSCRCVGGMCVMVMMMIHGMWCMRVLMGNGGIAQKGGR